MEHEKTYTAARASAVGAAAAGATGGAVAGNRSASTCDPNLEAEHGRNVEIVAYGKGAVLCQGMRLTMAPLLRRGLV